MTGGKSKPRAVLEAEGTTNATRHAGKDLASGRKKLLAVPGYLPPVAKTFYKRVAADALAMNISDRCDSSHIEYAAMLHYRLREANKILIREGVVITDEKGVKKRHPAALEAMQITAKLMSWFSEMGMTPSARAALGGGKLDPRTAKGADKDADLEAKVFGK